jgi:hypothetical protein
MMVGLKDLTEVGESVLPDGWIEISLGEISHRITKGTTPTSVGFQ